MQRDHFEFGKNWQRFLKFVNEKRIETAKDSLLKFLALDNLKRKSFLDVGCGSGIFSYGAFLAGVKEVISFDIDKFSVRCCRYFYERAGRPSNWHIYEGSILDEGFISKLPRFDIVYAWGVLHHTGNMWQALKNTATLVKEDGLLYLAIYNKKDGPFGSFFWLKIKRFYNRSPEAIKYIMQIVFIISYIIFLLLKLNNPIKRVANYGQKRGMVFLTDVRDWLGGLPYEFANPSEVINFLASDFELVKIKLTKRTGNNEYLFRKKRKKNL
ncbi:MAG: class I SAM-dependent methyltransferase [Candidatus Omnitrophica bacterium]|nr:class I SAM-dependent methyltransferase [Candidatus Omnitrophota bacterium]